MKTIKLKVIFDGSADDIYDAIINARTLGKITGGKASNTQKVSGKFTAYDDYIWGTNEELVPGKKIVQKWSCEDFPKDHFSTVIFLLNKKGEKQTEMDFTQENVPDDVYEDIKEGWNEFYFEPIKDWLEGKIWN